jgi:hypothetical protein
MQVGYSMPWVHNLLKCPPNRFGVEFLKKIFPKKCGGHFTDAGADEKPGIFLCGLTGDVHNELLVEINHDKINLVNKPRQG